MMVRQKSHLRGQVVYIPASGRGEGRAVCTGEGESLCYAVCFHTFAAHVVLLSNVTRQKGQHTLGGIKARPYLRGVPGWGLSGNGHSSFKRQLVYFGKWQ